MLAYILLLLCLLLSKRKKKELDRPRAATKTKYAANLLLLPHAVEPLVPHAPHPVEGHFGQAFLDEDRVHLHVVHLYAERGYEGRKLEVEGGEGGGSHATRVWMIYPAKFLGHNQDGAVFRRSPKPEIRITFSPRSVATANTAAAEAVKHQNFRSFSS